MSITHETPNAEKLRSLIESRGYGIVQFSNLLYGTGKRRNVLSELKNRPDMRSSTLVRICKLLDIPMDVLFSDDNNSPKQTTATSLGTNSSTPQSTEILLLKSQLESQKLLLAEKDSRIEELKKYNDDLSNRVSQLLKSGQSQD